MTVNKTEPRGVFVDGSGTDVNSRMPNEAEVTVAGVPDAEKGEIASYIKSSVGAVSVAETGVEKLDETVHDGPRQPSGLKPGWANAQFELLAASHCSNMATSENPSGAEPLTVAVTPAINGWPLSV